MLGVGWTEMLVIGVVALIVIGPKELPALMQKIGRFAATVRRMGADFQRELNKTTGLDEVKNLRTAITQPLKETSDAIRREFNTVSSTGAVQPSGALKPADPKAESVVSEIHAAAGMSAAKPAEPVKAAIAPSTAGPAAAATPAAKPKRAPAKRTAKPKVAASAAPAAKTAVAKAKPAAAEAAPAAEAKAKPRPKRKPAAKKA